MPWICYESDLQLTGAHLYLDIAKSGYLFHAVWNNIVYSILKWIWIHFWIRIGF